MDSAERIIEDRIENEKSLLAAILCGSDRSYELALGLAPEMFYVPKHRTIFEACQRIIRNGGAIDRFSVAEEIRKIDPDFSHDRYIYDLIEWQMVHPGNIAKRVKDRYKLDRLNDIAVKIVNESPGVADPEEFVQERLTELYELGLSSDKIRIFPFKEALNGAYESIRKAHENKGDIGLNIGIPAINDLIHGLQPGYLILIAGRPSIGKTALAVNIMEHISVNAQRQPTMFISLEMSGIEIAKRIIAGRMEGYKPSDIRRGNLGDDKNAEGWIALDNTINKLYGAPIYLAEPANIRIADLAILCKSAVARYGVKAIFIDYLQLIQEPQKHNRNEEVSFISRSLKGMARELNIPIVALSQLNRLGANTRPNLAYLRDSGSLEQDADQVLFVFREEITDQKEVDAFRELYGIEHSIGDIALVGEIIVAKARNEQTGKATVMFNPDEIRYVEIDV